MYTHILIATDGSELADKGVDTGLALAAALQAGVTLVTASEPWQEVMPGDPSALALSCELRDEARKARGAAAAEILDRAQARAAARNVAAATVYVQERTPADAIIHTAAQCGADLVVMASHGRSGLRKLLLGSQAQAVLARGTLPVLVVR